MLMRDTVFCVILVDANTSAITVSVKKQVAEVQ
jgi:acetaldehyde dehydrogenase (acetylating)